MNGGRVSDSRWRRLRLPALVALALHLALGLAVAKAPPPEPLPLPPERDQVATFSQTVRLPRSQPAPRKKEEPPPPPKTPPPPPPKTPPSAPTAAVASAAPAPKPAAPRPATKRPPAPGKAAPKTVSLGNVGLGGNVQVHSGDGDDVLGDPAVTAAPESQAPEPPAAPSDGPGGQGTGPSAAPQAAPKPDAPNVVVPPRVKRAEKGVYPPDAPRLGRRIPITLSLRIGPDGRVLSARIVTKPPAAGTAFDAEAKRLALALQFEPATRDGAAIPFSIRYVVEFEP